MAEEAARERIGEYLVRRLVGEGGMGKVYEAEERLSKRRVALKVLRAELARSEEGRRMFLNEMTILAHLDHPNVVRCLACTEADGQLVMALEFLDGQTLRNALNERRRYAWDEATGIAWQIAQALSIAHRQSPPIVHRDLKPENIMLLADGTVKVMDFGIAKVLQAISRTTTQNVGTLQYMSPEQIDARTVDERSDLYCLGLVLYEMLSGGPPFESASPRELLNMQCTTEPPPLADDVRRGLPSGIERLVYALLAKKPEDRPASAAEVAAQLEPFRPAGGARPVVADTQPISPPRSAAPTPRPAHTMELLERATAPRNVPIGAALAIVLGLSAVAGVATYLIHSSVADTEAAP
jgi:serine/threonine protein kinase